MTSTDNASRHRYGVLGASAATVVTGTLGLIGLADAATESDGLAAFDPELTTDAFAGWTVAIAWLTIVLNAASFVHACPEPSAGNG